MLLCQKCIFEILTVFSSISFSAFPLTLDWPSSSQEKVMITLSREKESFLISESSSFRAQKRRKLGKEIGRRSRHCYGVALFYKLSSRGEARAQRRNGALVNGWEPCRVSWPCHGVTVEQWSPPPMHRKGKEGALKSDGSTFVVTVEVSSGWHSMGAQGTIKVMYT